MASLTLFAAPAAASRCGVASAEGKRQKPLAKQITCLVNRARAARGLSRLRRSGKLSHAARTYARWMARRNVFSHFGVGTPAARAARTGYLSGAAGWTVGETLAFSRRRDAGWVVRAWLRSPAHRNVLLRADFEEIGVGASRGTPRPGRADGITVAADFGVR
jgi:uncharacterized protein YkwD